MGAAALLLAAAPILAVVPKGAAAASAVAATAFQEDPAHDGHVDDPAFSLPLRTAWAHTYPGSVWYPLIVGGRVFVDVSHYDFREDSGASNPPHGTSVYAYDLATGALDWGPVDIGGDKMWGFLAYDNGRLLASNATGEIYALDPTTGQVQWTTHTFANPYFCWAPLTAANGGMYIACGGSGGAIYAFDDATGADRWMATTDGDISGPAVAGDDVLLDYACSDAYDFGADGTLRWHHSEGCYGGGEANGAIADSHMYIHDSTDRGEILDRTTGATIAPFTGSRIVTAPAINGSMMYDSLQDYSCQTNCASWVLRGEDSATGALRWTDTTNQWVMAPLSVNTDVISAAPDGTVAVFDGGTGARLWTGSTGDAIDGTEQGSWEDPRTMAEAGGYLAVPTQHTITVFASSPSGSPTPTATPAASPSPSSTLTPSPARDTTPPSVTVDWRSRIVRGSTATLRWSGRDGDSGIASFDVRYRVAAIGQRFAAYRYPTSEQHTTKQSLSLRINPGATICASVRGRDRAGNASSWTKPICSTSLVDDRTLAATSSWKRTRGSGFYDDTATTATGYGVALRTPHLTAARITVLALTCPTCGAIRIFLPGAGTVTLSLYARTTQKQLLTVPRRATKSGTVAITIASTGKRVTIDAIAATATL
jgi:outer membrane protein assembly factor BamB